MWDKPSHVELDVTCMKWPGKDMSHSEVLFIPRITTEDLNKTQAVHETQLLIVVVCLIFESIYARYSVLEYDILSY